MADTYETCELINYIHEIAKMDAPEHLERVAEFLGDDWESKSGQNIEVKICEGCTRIDTETSYSWAE
tara:strand:- start:179 stop:379 length:201 start_codon:yes stop_codon:yes gene_type:complete